MTITTYSKDRVQEQVSDTNSGADEFVTTEEVQYFTQVLHSYVKTSTVIIITSGKIISLK